MTQYARPNTDISKTGWTGVSDNTNLYNNIDESSASEADYNYSTHNAIRTYECKLSGVSDPSSGSGHVVSYRIAASDSSGSIPGSGDSGNSLDVAISVYQGTTLIATTTITVPEDPETQTLTLSSGEANAITDYSDLRIRFVTTASGGSGSSRRGMAVFWCELAVPNAPTEQYAVKSGNWNDTTVWSTGVPPTTGTVYANGYTVTVNVNASATLVTTAAGTVAVAGGAFALSTGVTLTANVTAGTSIGLTYSGSSGNSATVIGTITGSSTTGSMYGASITSAGTLNVTGNPTGGGAASAHGIWVSGAGILNVTGNPTGGSGTSAAGIRANAGNVFVNGTPAGGSGASPGVITTSTTNLTLTGNPTALAGFGVRASGSGTVAITGSATGGSIAGAVGVLNDGSGTVSISEDATGGTNTTAYGVSNTGSGTTSVAGKAISNVAAGVASLSGSGYATVGTVETGTSGISPCAGHVHVADLSTFTALVRSSASSVTLSADADVPSPFEPSPVFGGV